MLRHVLVSVALVTSLSLFACKSDTQATPRVIYDSTVTNGAHTQTQCGQSGEYLVIGDFGNPAAGHVNPADDTSALADPPVPVDDGSAFAQGTVSISCSVTANGDAFDVKASAQLTGATGGAVTITGTINQGVDSPNITMNVTRMGQTYSSGACTVSFDTTLGHGIEAGRVWANIDCPDATDSTAQLTCDSSAQFRFENCSQ